jgi:outer membrane protein assembly factor BamA
LGINARWNGLNRVGAGYSARSSISLLENDLQSGYNSFKERGYYLDAYINSLDYVYNPRKGWLIEFFVEAGKRERKHEAKNAKNYVKVHAQADRFFQLFNKSALRVRTISGWQNGRNFFYNEMQRLGGFNSFRGLDEDALFASAYSIMTLEYRFLFEEKSNVNVFTDLAYYEADRIENRISDTPVSFGIGVQLQTGAGIIRFSYALAREFDNSFKFRNAKFHIGLINEF